MLPLLSPPLLLPQQCPCYRQSGIIALLCCPQACLCMSVSPTCCAEVAGAPQVSSPLLPIQWGEIPPPPLLFYTVPKPRQRYQGFPRKQLPPSLLKTQPCPGGPGWGTMFPTGGWVFPHRSCNLILSQGCAYQPFSAQESVICRTTLQQPNPGRPRSPSPDVGPHGSTRQPQAETVHGPVQREVFLPSRYRCPLTQQDLSKTGSSSCHFDKLQGRGSLLLVSPVSQGNGETLKA